MVTPTNAWSYYGSSTTHTADPSWAVATNEIPTLARALGAGRTGVSASAYSQNVFDYIRNNVATEFRFGLGKGGRGALIDQSGTPFDQAELMAKLLRQAGVTANYQVGNITLTAAQFGAWTGLVTGLNQSTQTFTVSAQAACQFLADGGIPAVVNGVVDDGVHNYCNSQVSGNLSSVTMGHIWISANGDLYDPSFKQYYLKQGIDLASAMGCGTESSPTCGTSAQAALLSGATTGTLGSTSAPTIQHLNESGVDTQFTTFATALESTIKSTNSIAALSDVIGGPTRNLAYSPVASASLPYTTSSPTTWTGDIPDQFRTHVSYQFCGATLSMMADTLSGRRIRRYATVQPITSLPAQEPRIVSTYIDDVDVSDCSWSTYAPSQSTLTTLTAQPPYAAGGGSYGATVFNGDPLDPVTSGPDITLSLYFQLGEASDSTAKFYADLQEGDPYPFAGMTALPGLANCNSTAPVYTNCSADVTTTGVRLLSQESRAAQAVTPIVGAAVRHQIRLGYVTAAPAIVGTNVLYKQISIMSAASSESYAGDTATASAAFELLANLSSAVEGSVTQQEDSAFAPISSAAAFVLNNRLGGQIVDIAPSNMSAAIPYLTGYGTRTYNLQALASAGYESIIFQNGQIICVVSTCGPITPISPDYEIQTGSIGLLLSETLKGGGINGTDPAGGPLATVKRATETEMSKNQGESVDLASGQVTLAPAPDIVTGVGGFPASLPFQRFYQSAAGVSEQEYTGGLKANGIGIYTGPDSTSEDHLGGGWQHNYQVTAQLYTDASVGMGQNRAIDATSFIAATYVASTLLKSPTFDSRLTSVFADYWMDEQLFNNIVHVKVGPKSLEFTRLPDATFAPPAHSSAMLVQGGTAPGLVNSTFYLGVHCAPGATYDYSGVTYSLTNPGGDVISFNNAHQTQDGDDGCASLGFPVFKGTQWVFPDGNTVTFHYTTEALIPFESGDTDTHYLLSSVSNSLGRSLTFSSTWAPVYAGAGGEGSNGSLGWMINSVQDENYRTVTFARSGCTNLYRSFDVVGSSVYLTCSTFSVTKPDGTVWTYSYAPGSDSPDPTLISKAPYHLRRWYTPDAPTTAYKIIAYDSLYRAATVTDILGHAASYYPSDLFPTELWKRTDFIDPVGNLSTEWFDMWNDRLQATDPLGHSKLFAYDSAQRLVLEANPLLDCSAMAYDIRSNLLSTSNYPRTTCAVAGQSLTLSSSPPTPIVTQATYVEGTTVFPCVNPVTCNRTATSTDPLGNVTSYTYDTTTGLPTEVLYPSILVGDPDYTGQPQTNFAYSTYTGSDGATIHLVTQKTEAIEWDQNRVTNYTYNTSNKFTLSTATVDPSGLALRTCFKFDAFGNLISVSDPRTTTCP